MRLERRAWMAAAVALLLAWPAAAQDGRVLGRVTDGAGNAIAGAVVTMADSGGAPRTTATGSTGGFQFDGVPAGEYTLRVAGEGFAPRERRVVVRPGRPTTTVVRLTRGRG